MSVPWYLMAKGKGGGGYKTASGPIVSVNDALAAPLRSLVANIEPVQSGSGDPSPDNVRPISGWSAVNVWLKPTYDPTANPAATIQLGDTYYGGTLDVTNGVLTVTHAEVDLGTWNWTKQGSDDLFYSRHDEIKFQGELLSSNYAGYVGSLNSMPDCAVSATNSQAYLLLRVKDSSKWATMDATQFKAAMSGVQLVYELATPITIPLIPMEISTLQGQNNVWADTGDVTVEYLSSDGTDPDLMKLAVAFMGRK